MAIKMLLANSLNILKKDRDISKRYQEWQYLPEVFFEDVDVDKWYGDGD